MKFIYTIIILVCLFSSNANAQSKVGIKAGTNLSYVSGLTNVESKAKVGPMVGLFADLAAFKHVHFQPEVLFSIQGTKNSYAYNNHMYSAHNNVNLSYLNVPFLVKVYVKGIVYFYAGPQYGFLMSAVEKVESSGGTTKSDIRNVFQHHEFSMVYGTGFDFLKHFNFGARLNYGVSDIRVQPSTYASNKLSELNNRGFQFHVGYAF